MAHVAHKLFSTSFFHSLILPPPLSSSPLSPSTVPLCKQLYTLFLTSFFTLPSPNPPSPLPSPPPPLLPPQSNMPASKLPRATPSTTVSLKVPRHTLRSTTDSGLRKSSALPRILASHTHRRITVHGSPSGTTDSLFFTPERPAADSTHGRATPAQFAKISPGEHCDAVRAGDAFQISFVGMSVTHRDAAPGNELLLCSLRKSSRNNLTDRTTTTSSSAVGMLSSSGKLGTTVLNGSGSLCGSSQLPSSLQVRDDDIPFIHFDPVVDGRDIEATPDSFVPVPGSKRLYVQHGADKPSDTRVIVRFSVMEVDKLSEEEMCAIRNIENIGKSVGKSASSVPFLKPVGWMLKIANVLGKVAMRKMPSPDQVLSKDVEFFVADAEDAASEVTDTASRVTTADPYGNYLRVGLIYIYIYLLYILLRQKVLDHRLTNASLFSFWIAQYGYYFFLNKPVDAQLFAQTGSSSQSVSLLLKRHGYDAARARKNEKEFIPLTGVSYVVMKVTRGYAPGVDEERREVLDLHKERFGKLLQKYAGQAS